MLPRIARMKSYGVPCISRLDRRDGAASQSAARNSRPPLRAAPQRARSSHLGADVLLDTVVNP